MYRHVAEDYSFISYTGSQTKFPQDWIPLLEDPCKFLKGPNCDSVTPKENVGIVGAGISGVTMAWILQYLGHKVIFLIYTYIYRIVSLLAR